MRGSGLRLERDCPCAAPPFFNVCGLIRLPAACQRGSGLAPAPYQLRFRQRACLNSPHAKVAEDCRSVRSSPLCHHRHALTLLVSPDDFFLVLFHEQEGISLANFVFSLLGVRLPEKGWDSIQTVLAVSGFVLFLISRINRRFAERIVSTWDGVSAWWMLLPVGLFVIYRIMRANYKANLSLEKTVKDQDQVIDDRQSKETIHNWIGQRLNDAKNLAARLLLALALRLRPALIRASRVLPSTLSQSILEGNFAGSQFQVPTAKSLWVAASRAVMPGSEGIPLETASPPPKFTKQVLCPERKLKR